MSALSRRAALACGLSALLLALPIAGCANSDGRPKVVKAGGRVLYKGQPVEGAVVTFTNEAVNTSAYAKTGPDGRFLLTTFGHEDGAIPGAQKVAVSKTEVVEKSKPGADYSTSSAVPPTPEVKQLLPTRYVSPATSGLQVEVKVDDKNDFVLELN